MLGDLKVQQEKGEYCDVVLHVNDQQFYAHRCVLAANGSFFNNVFTQNQTNEPQHLSFPSTNPHVLKSVLDFIYTGTVSVALCDADELLALCSTLEITELRKLCCEAMQKHLDISNWSDIRQLASKHNIPELTLSVTAHLSENFAFIKDDEHLLDLDVKEILTICKRCNLNGDKDIERDRFRLILNWISHDYESRECYYAEIMQTVNPDNLNSQAVHSLLDFQASKGCNLREHFVTHALIKFVTDRENFEHEKTKETDACLSQIPVKPTDTNKISVETNEATASATNEATASANNKQLNIGVKSTQQEEGIVQKEHEEQVQDTSSVDKNTGEIKDESNESSDHIELTETKRVTRRTGHLKTAAIKKQKIKTPGNEKSVNATEDKELDRKRNATEDKELDRKRTSPGKRQTRERRNTPTEKCKRGRPRKTQFAEVGLPDALNKDQEDLNKHEENKEKKPVANETMPESLSVRKLKEVKGRIKHAQQKTSSTQTISEESDDKNDSQSEMFPPVTRRPRSKKITPGKWL